MFNWEKLTSELHSIITIRLKKKKTLSTTIQIQTMCIFLLHYSNKQAHTRTHTHTPQQGEFKRDSSGFLGVIYFKEKHFSLSIPVVSKIHTNRRTML